MTNPTQAANQHLNNVLSERWLVRFVVNHGGRCDVHKDEDFGVDVDTGSGLGFASDSVEEELVVAGRSFSMAIFRPG